MRREFGKMIVELAEKDNKIILITGDVEHNMDEFKKKFPERFFDFGLCEQSIVSVASGLALSGFKPYFYTITPFLIERAFEQIKLDVDGQNVNVKLIGYADYPTAGPSHSPLNAETLMSILKNTISYFPKNSDETQKAIIESYNHKKPTFISLKRDKRIYNLFPKPYYIPDTSKVTFFL